VVIDFFVGAIAGVGFPNLILGKFIAELFVRAGVFYSYKSIDFLPFVFAIRYLNPKES